MRSFVIGGAGFIGSHLVDLLVERGPVTIYDNMTVGRQAKPYLHVTECAKGILYVFDHAKGEKPNIYNLAPEGYTSVRKIADWVVAASPYKTARVEYGGGTQGWPGDVPLSLLDSSKVNAQRVTQVYVRRDFSYRMKRIVGENYALIGDAAGFLDPIFSTGVFIAMKSADIASTAVEARLRNGGMRLLKRYQRDMSNVLERYFRFISNFYRREFLEVFLQPGEHFGLLPVIIGVLAGNVFTKKWDRMKLGLFFALVAIQKRKQVIAPPIVWDALPAAASSV